ncbi:MAG: acyltransferase family protein [Sphingomonadales bacterium]
MEQEQSDRARKPKLDSVQMLRGLGAILVVGIHLNNWLYAQERAIGPSHIAYFANWHQFGAIGVDIFFVISGFVIALTMGRYQGRPGTFIVQRFLRIAPLAYIFSGLWMLRLHLIGGSVPLPGVLSTIELAPVLPSYALPTLDVLWTLSFEFTFYLLVCAVLLLRKGPMTLFFLTLLLAPIGLVHSFGYPLLRFSTHPMLLEFALGMAAYLLWRDNLLNRPLRIASGVIGAAALLAQALFGSGIAANPALAISGETALARVLQWALPSFLILNFLVAWQPRAGIAQRIAVKIGDASYSIYVVHLFVISMLIHRIPLPPDGRWLTLFVLVLVAGVAVYQFVEKPLASLAARIGRKRDTPAAKPLDAGAS